MAISSNLHMHQITDEQVKEMRRGNELVFRMIFNSYYPRLVALSMKCVNNQMVAEDIVTDVFRKVWEKRESISEVGSFDSFLHTAVRHATLNSIRNSKRHESHHQLILRDLSEEGFEEIIFEEDIHYRLHQAIKKLPPRGRKVFELSVLFGWKEMEIAEDLQMSINTVKTHKKRAIKSLRKHLGKYFAFLFLFC